MASKNTYQAQSQGTLTDDEFFARLDAVAGVKQEAAEKPKESAGVLRTAGDLGLKAAQGVVGLGQAAIGLGNLATGGLVGKGMRRAGYDPERTNQAIGEYLSDSQKESDRKVQEADGFFGTAQAMLENPRSIIGGAAQSAPGMLLGGGITSAVARRIGAAAAAPLGGLQTPAGQAAAKAAVEKAAGRLMLTGSSAEGAQAAGQIAEKAEREGRGWGDYVLPSVGAGIGTAAIGRATGKLMGDSETAIFSGAKSAAAKGSLPIRVVKSGASEGIEETLQSGQQQSMENIALGKEWDDEIDKAMGQGLVVGSAMGLGTGAFTRADNARQQQAVASAQQSGGIVSRAGLAATPGAQQPNPVAPNPAAPQPTAAVAPGAAGQPAAGTAAGAASPTQPAQTPIQASALSAIEQALEANKQRRRTAGEVVEDEVEEGDVVAAGNPAAVDPPDAAPSPAMQAQPAQTTQPASAGFSSPKFDNSPIPKMDPAEAAEQRRVTAEFEQKRKNRRAGTRSAAWERNPFLAFLGANGLNRDTASEFAPGLTERRKAFVPGYGPVFRPGAKNLDELVQTAKEDGFLRDDDGEPELYDLIDRALRGERIAPLFADGAAEAEGQRRQQAMQEREGATFEDYLEQQEQESDPLDFTVDADYDEQDLAEIGSADVSTQNEVAALQQQYADLGFDPADVLESLATQTENQTDQQFYDLAKSRFIQLIDQAYGQAEPQAEQGSNRAVRQPDGQEGAAQADGSAAGGQGQAAAVTPPAAPAVAQPRRTDAIRAKLDDLKSQGFSQFTRSSGRTLLLNPDTYETVELTPAEMAVARTASGQARAGLQSLRGQRNPAQVDQQGVDVLQSYSPADVLTQEEQASQQQAADQAERDKAQAQARADDERKRIEQASYAAADSFELGQNQLDSLTGQKDIFGAAPVAQGLAGEKINDEWTAFGPQSGTLGIPRAEMPQIKAEHRGAMMGFLKARGIDGQQETIPSAAIKPTQAEFSPAKVRQAIDYQGGNRSIIVSADGYVVDGHHQWLAAREKGEPIRVIRLDQNIGDVLTALKDMPSAQPDSASTLTPEQIAEQAQALLPTVRRYASGLTAIGDLAPGARASGGAQLRGVGVDVGLVSKNAIEVLGNAIVNQKAAVFVDSGAFSAFRRGLKSGEFEPLDFNAILARYDAILDSVGRYAEEDGEQTNYPLPLLVMPDVVGSQSDSLVLIREHRDWIAAEVHGNLSQPIIPIQKGEMSMAEAYRQVVQIIGSEDFIVGIPSNEQAVTPGELQAFLADAKPKAIHILGAASDIKLQPRLESVVAAGLAGKIQITADASPIRSKIIRAVANGAKRGDAIKDLLYDENDPGYAQPEQGGRQSPARDYESDMRLYPSRVLEQVGANGELAKLYAKAGVRSADAFGGLSADDQAAAYAEFVADGGKPAGNLPQSYSDSVMEEERQIRRRQLQGERTITQANGKPFKTEAGAKAMLDQFDLGDTHKIVSEGGGYALRQMPPAEQAESRRKAEGRESYMEAQAAVIAEMGIPLTADGEIDAADEQWDEIDQRIAERLGQKPVADKQPTTAPEWKDMTPEQRRRARLEREIATGMTNNGGVMASLRPSAIEKRKQELAAMGDAGKLDAAPAQQDSQAAADQPIASRPFATAIEKTKTGWIIKGDPETLAQHARDIFGRGVVKRKDGISLATKTDDVAGNFPARFDEYRLADLPERHGRIEVRVNQDGSASVRSMDGGYMGPQLSSVAEAIANHRKEFGDGDSGVKQADAQPASSTAAANEEAQLKTVRDVADKLGMEYVSGLLADSLKKGQTFSLQGKQYTVAAVTDSRIRLKSSDGKTIEALKYGNKLVSSGNAKSQPYAQFVRDLEGVISVDLINESNPFHRPSEVFVLAQKALDALPADMKAVRPESAAGAGNADQVETGREGYDTPVELDAAQLKAILEQTRGEPLVDKPAKLEAWRNGTSKTDQAKFPIELVFRPDGKLDVNDGRHRIALAAERGEKVTAFIDSKDAQGARDLLAMGKQQAAGNAPSTAGVATSGAVNADLEAIFDQLDGITQRTQAAGQQAAAAHPQAERIQFVQKHILDILEDLEDGGKVTINC